MTFLPFLVTPNLVIAVCAFLLLCAVAGFCAANWRE